MKKDGVGFKVGLCELLTLLFIGLKLTGFIDWSWFWVLSPIFIPLIIIGGFLITGFIMYVLKN